MYEFRRTVIVSHLT